MIYLEFIDWDRRLPVDIFHHLKRQDGWQGEADDEQVINVGRHKGLADKPAYLCGWRISNLARIDEWEIYFKSLQGRTDYAELAAFQGLDFIQCGIYDELRYRRLTDDSVHFIEYFDAGDASDSELHNHFQQRDEQSPQSNLACLFRRVGLLGPPVSDIALWSFPNLAAVETIAREQHSGSRFPPCRVGVYRNVGQELM